MISHDELKRVLGAISGGQFGDAEIAALMSASDTNKDGFIQYEEFVQWVTSDIDQSPQFKPLDKRGSFQVDYRKLLPERFQVDVKDRYNLDKLTLGEGGFGKVFIARDKEFSDRKVAVKKVQKPRRHAEKEMNDLQKEIQVMKDLDHPNICKLLATFEEGQNVYFIMELCEGGELFDRIIENGFITEKFSSVIVGQVASALSYAHGRGIAHRDIKPENVVFCTPEREDTRVKLIDWGLATGFKDEQMTKAVGSMTYAAPEVIASQDRKAYSEACDLWSIGVLTYVMLCGKPPFWGTREQHYRAAKNERYPLKDDPWDKMNPDAIDFVKRLLKADPNKRLPITECSQHNWIKNQATLSDSSSVSVGVMNNLKNFTNQTTFTKLCITAVARQLDHKHLKDIHQVFKELDADGNGVLSVDEVRAGIRKIGGDSADVECVEQMFKKMDMDGSKSIDYTEFCAAAMGEKAVSQDEMLWAAFKTFDVDNTGTISVDNLKTLLDNADVQNEWSPEVCREVGQDIVTKYDSDGDGNISFADFQKMMEKNWSKSQTHNVNARDILAQVNSLDLSAIK